MTTPLDRLRSLTPSPADGEVHRDWAAVERDLALPLPQDYKELADTFGFGGFYGHIQLIVPPPTGIDSDLIRRNRSHMQNLNDLWSVHKNRPAELSRDDLRLLMWADTIDSDSLNWLVQPGEPPERWPVVVLHCDLGDCEIYPVTCTEFLARLFSQELESGILSEQLDEEEAPFAAYPIARDR
jgi:hypothetical protein